MYSIAICSIAICSVVVVCVVPLGCVVREIPPIGDLYCHGNVSSVPVSCDVRCVCGISNCSDVDIGMCSTVVYLVSLQCTGLHYKIHLCTTHILIIACLLFSDYAFAVPRNTLCHFLV